MSAADPPQNAISLQMVSLLNHGVTVQYERFVAPPRISLATSIGGRLSGGHDYDVIESGYGIEGRFWFAGKTLFVRYERPAMVGPYLGLRLDFGLTRVASADDGRVLGQNLRIAESANLGVRFVFFDRLEVTPSFGLGMRTDIDPRGRLAPWTRPEFFRFGLTLGALF